MQIEIGANLTTVVLAFVASVGTIVTGVLSYLNGQRLKEVQKNTNGMTEQMVASAFEGGRTQGAMEERARLGLVPRPTNDDRHAA